MSKPTGKTYEIDSFETLINVVNVDNADRIIPDLCMWLAYSAQIVDALRKKHKKYCKDKTNWDLARSCFVWTDDGENKMTHVRVKNLLTGEIQTIEFKKS